MNHVLTQLDYVAILVYLAGTLALGLWIGRRVRSGTDYFLAGRSLPWWAIGMSLVATDIGGTDIIGVGGAAAKHGLAVANFEWIGCVPAMIVAAFVFVPFFYRTGIYTVPEFMERRYNVGVRSALALCWLLFMACNVGRLVWAVVFAYAFLKQSEESGIYAVFQTLMSFFQGPALAILLAGLFWKRATGTAALAAFLCGIACSVSLFTLNQPPVYEALGWQPLFRIPDPFLYYSVWAFLLAVVVLIGVSLLTRPDPEEKTQYMLRGKRGNTR